MKKVIFIVIDGLGDKSISQFGNLTPLAAAKTLNLDWLAKNGFGGLLKPFKFSWQKYPASDTCHLALFGYDPGIYYLGRGPYEALGIGLKLKKNDLALRANFAFGDESFKVLDRRAGRIEKTRQLIRVLSGKTIKGVKFLLKKSFGHRAVLILRGDNLSDKISDSDPKREGLKIKKVLPLEKSSRAAFTAGILNEFLFQVPQVLKKFHLPANCLLTRGAGFFKEVRSFNDKYHLKAACIAGGNLYKGIGRALGMDLIKVEGANGFSSTNLKGKILAARRALKLYDFIFLHIKAADSLAEDGDFKGKKKFIEKIDENLKPLLALKKTLLVVTADHSTCSRLKRHCAEPIPTLIYGAGSDLIERFSERACRKGKLGKIRQLALMKKILTLV